MVDMIDMIDMLDMLDMLWYTILKDHVQLPHLWVGSSSLEEAFSEGFMMAGEMCGGYDGWGVVWRLLVMEGLGGGRGLGFTVLDVRFRDGRGVVVMWRLGGVVVMWRLGGWRDGGAVCAFEG